MISEVVILVGSTSMVPCSIKSWILCLWSIHMSMVCLCLLVVFTIFNRVEQLGGGLDGGLGLGISRRFLTFGRIALKDSPNRVNFLLGRS